VQASLPSGWPFRANIPSIIDLHDSQLLLARQAPNGGLYIIEKAGDGVFLACRLLSWVKEESLKAGLALERDNYRLGKLCDYENQFNAGTAFPVTGQRLAETFTTIAPNPKRPKNRRGVVARNSIIPKSEPRQLSIAQQERSPDLRTVAATLKHQTGEDILIELSSSSHPANNVWGVNSQEEQRSPTDASAVEKDGLGPDLSHLTDDAFANQRETLLKTLYTSRMPLAYFAKSNLARTRATFRASASTNASDLADFYRNRLIPPKKMDLKYRATIPKIVENARLDHSPHKREINRQQNRPPKKRSSRKRLGKDGLYVGEEDYIRTWWLNQEEQINEATNALSQELEMQNLLNNLRDREIELQIVLILEIMSLESRKEDGKGVVLPAAVLKREPDDDESRHVLAKTPARTSTKRDLRPDLDILVDRLCIYQSVGITETFETEEAKKKNGAPSSQVRDKLRDFCCNVILPFYLHKAPDIVKEISQKLGGPSLTPKRPITSSKTISSVQTKLGIAADARRRSIPRRTLERVLSEDQGSRQSSPPALMRSVVVPLGGSCGRDPVETSQRPGSRGSLNRSRSFTNREVDLVASSKAQHAKRTKLANLAEQKEELDAAIHALKKPNRRLVGKEIMAEAEKRNTQSETSKRLALGRRSSNPSLGVQISATPRKGAYQDIAAPKRSALNGVEDEQPEDWDRSLAEEPTIPSSTIRNVNYRPGEPSGQTSCMQRVLHPTYSAVQETPSRGTKRATNPLALPSNTHPTQQPESPSGLYFPPSLSVVQATPSANRLRPDDEILDQIENTPLRMTKSQRPVMFMPLKKVEIKIESVFRDAPIISERAGKMMERAMNGDGGGGREVSIYDSLGWDDDIDELL
jgi:DNA replication regulator SLD3